MPYAPTKPSSNHPSLSLVLPAWNEEEVILRAIGEAEVALSQVATDYEIIVVDDGSSDQTAARVREASERNPSVRLIQHQQNCGYGAALRSGFNAAEKDLVAFTDADCQFDLTELDRFLLLSGKYDIVCGYRIDRKDTPLRCLYSRVYNQLVRLLLGTAVRDIDCALKMFRRDVVRELTISTDGFLINSELLTQAAQKGYSVVEVGVTHRPRTEGTSTVSVTHIPKVLASLLRYWWNAAQFPAAQFPAAQFPAAQLPAAPSPTTTQSSDNNQPTRHSCVNDRRWLRAVGTLLILCVTAFLFSNLGYPLLDRDETRYAEIPREMLISGDWILPQLNFAPYYDKPPLLYWLCGLSYCVFGVSEWSARLVPAMAALCMFASTLWFGSRMFGKRVGLLSASVLMLSFGFMLVSRFLLIDGVFAALVTLSLLSAHEAIRTPRLNSRWWIAASVFCGFAFLAKGPISIVLLAPPVIAFAWLTQNCARIRIRHWLLMAGTIAAIALPWFIAVSIRDPNFAYEFFVNHNVSRFAGGFHRKPVWYFVPVLLIAGHPWTFLTIPFGSFLLSRREEARTRRPPMLGFCLLWAAWCFAFFSASGCKLPTYLLPAAPAFALLMGYYLDHLLFQSPNLSIFRFPREHSTWASAATTCAAAISLGVFCYATGLETTEVFVAAVMLWSILLAVVLIAVRRSRDRRVTWGTSAGFALLLAINVTHSVMPKYARAHSVLGPDLALVIDGKHTGSLPIATFGHEMPGVPFYLGRSDVKNFNANEFKQLAELVAMRPETIVIAANTQPIDRLRGALPDEAQLRLVTSTRTCKVAVVDTSRLAKRTAAKNTVVNLNR